MSYKYGLFIIGNTMNILIESGGSCMKCKLCNHTINPTHKVCNKCGKRIHSPLHKSGWIWVIPIIFMFIVLGVFTSKADYKEYPAQVSELFDHAETAAEATLTSGSFIVGKDIIPGRYIITTNKGMGNLFIYKENIPYINEVLTYPHNSDSTVGVTKIETNLDLGDHIQISGLDSVVFSPVAIFQKTTLVSGYHLVGRDVPEGNYTIMVPEGSGNFIIYDATHQIRLNKFITRISSSSSEDALKISLKKDELIHINNLGLIELIP